MTDLNHPYGRQPSDAPQPDAVITRSEEELRIITHRREAQRARLIKYVETEPQTRTVEVRHERVRVEYQSISDDARQASAAGWAPSGDRWPVLYDEEIVVQTRWVARERVRWRPTRSPKIARSPRTFAASRLHLTTRHTEDEHG